MPALPCGSRLNETVILFEVRSMELTRPASSPAPRWRIALPVWLGIVLLLASVVTAAVSLRSHASDSSSPSSAAASSPGGEGRWMSIGYVDVEGGVTPLYPLVSGRIKSIQAHENEPVQADAELFRLDDSQAALKAQMADNDLKAAKQRVVLAEQKAQQYRRQIDAQKEAVEAAKLRVDQARVNRDKENDFYKKGISGDAQTVKNAEILVQQAKVGLRGEQKKLAALEAIDPDEGVKLARIDIEAKEVQLKEARKAVDEYIIRAPYAGTPLRILVSVGETLGPNPRQPAIQFCPDRPLIVRAEVEQEFAGRVHDKQSALIQDHITGEELGRGTIASISRWFTHRRSILLDPLQYNDVRTLECIIKLDSSGRTLRIGQRVRVRFPDSEK
jgi:multidrug resistance efflux pump